MEILQTAISALVVASVGLILARLAGQRFDALEMGLVRVEQRLDGRIDALDAKVETKLDAMDRKFATKIDALDSKFEAKIDALDAKVDSLDAKFDAKFDGLDRKFDAKVDALRADITQIALAVGARVARETG
jgi:Skp family chaperone for outer membrane proteins